MKNLIFYCIGFLFVLLFSAGCQKEDPELIIPQPSIEASAVPSNKGPVGDSILITLNWEAKNSTSCYLDDAPVALEGSKEVCISENTTFVFKAKNDKGIEVTEPVFAQGPVYEVPIIELSADPDSLPFGGGTTTLSWITQHADSVKYNGVWYAPNGSIEIELETTSSFTFAVRGKGGEINSMLTVKVTTLEEMLSAYLCYFGSFAQIEVVVYDYNLQGPSIVLFDYYNTLPCAQDDRGYFTMNPNIMVNDVGEYCPEQVGNAHIFTSNWWLNGYVLNDCRTIISLNENELVWTYPSNRGNIPIVIKETYKHVD